MLDISWKRLGTRQMAIVKRRNLEGHLTDRRTRQMTDDRYKCRRAERIAEKDDLLLAIVDQSFAI